MHHGFYTNIESENSLNVFITDGEGTESYLEKYSQSSSIDQKKLVSLVNKKKQSLSVLTLFKYKHDK